MAEVPTNINYTDVIKLPLQNFNSTLLGTKIYISK